VVNVPVTRQVQAMPWSSVSWCQAADRNVLGSIAHTDVDRSEKTSVDPTEVRRIAGSAPETCAMNAPVRRSSASEPHLDLSAFSAL
jgi:hypothetical protein